MRMRGGTLLRGGCRALASALGGACALLWVYTVWRLALRPGTCGPLEAMVTAGGWGLSLIPVHVTAHRRGTAVRPPVSRPARTGSAGTST